MLHREYWHEEGALGSHVAAMEAAANAVDPSGPLADQSATVAAFFDRAANALRTLWMRRAP